MREETITPEEIEEQIGQKWSDNFFLTLKLDRVYAIARIPDDIYDRLVAVEGNTDYYTQSTVMGYEKRFLWRLKVVWEGLDDLEMIIRMQVNKYTKNFYLQLVKYGFLLLLPQHKMDQSRKGTYRGILIKIDGDDRTIITQFVPIMQEAGVLQ